MIRTALQGRMTVNAVMDELIARHSRIHEIETKRHDYGHGRGRGKGSRFPSRLQKPWQSYHAEDEAAWYGESWDASSQSLGGYEDEVQSEESYHSEETYDDVDPYIDSHANLVEYGLDDENHEALEYAAEIIQAEGEIYYAHKRAQHAGLAGFGGYVDKGKGKGKGRMTNDEKRARIEALKKRTVCRRCGQTGHWSTDAACPKNRKGYGKTSGSTSPTSSTGGGSPKGGTRKSPGKGSPKPRMVYFTVNEYTEYRGDGSETAETFMAVRSTPEAREPTADELLDRALAEHHARQLAAAGQAPVAMPFFEDPLALPGGFLEPPGQGGYDPHAVSGQPHALVPSHGLPADIHFVHPTGADLVPVPEDEMDYDDMTPPLVNYVPNVALMPTTPMKMPTPSPASPMPTARNPGEEVFSTPPSAPAAECQHLRTTKQGSNGTHIQVRCLDCNKIIKSEAREAASTMETRDRRECIHVQKDYRGTTGTSWKWTCKDCGEKRAGNKQPGQTGEAVWRAYVLASECEDARSASSAPRPCSSTPTGYVPPVAAGTGNAGRVVELMQMALVIQRELMAGAPIESDQLDVIYNKCRNRVYGTHFDPSASMSRTGTTPRTSSAATSHRFSPVTPTPASPARSTAAPAHASVPASPTPSRASRTSSRSATSYVAREVKPEDLADWEDEVLQSGARKGMRFRVVRVTDYRYCCFIVQKYESGGLRDPGLVEFARFLKLAGRVPTDIALMAVDGEHLPEDSMLAVIDTGCNNTCHGSKWFETYQRMMGIDIPLEETIGNYMGVGGRIKVKGQRRIPVVFQLRDGGEGHGTIVSTELDGSEAPLLLSTRAQRALGLTIDLGDHDEDVNIYSKAMNGDLEVINRGGLPALRLLSGEHREGDVVLHADMNEASVYVDTEEASTNDPVSPKNEIEEEDTLGYLSLEDCPIKAMSKGQKKRLQQSLETVEKEDAALWSTLRSEKPMKPSSTRRLLSRGCGTFLMELFAGAATLTWMAASWTLPVSEPIDCLYNYDLLKPAHRAEVEKRIQIEDPFLVSLAPICGPWSTMQWINLARGGETEAKILEDRKKWYPVIQWLAGLIKDRLSKGREVLLESPFYGLLWKLKCMDDLMADCPVNAVTGEPLELQHIDQCRYGLRDPGTGLALKKPTGLLTASEWMKLRLQRRCQDDHQHRPIEGSNISKMAEQWPPELCEQILGGALDEMIYGNLNMAFPAELEAEEHQEQGLLDSVLHPDDLAPLPKRRRTDDPDFLMEEKMQENAKPDDMPDVAMKQEEKRRQNWLKLPREKKRLALRRLHNMTGHRSHAAMIRMLKASGCDRDVIHAVKFFQCEVCAETAKEEKPAIAKPPRPAYQQKFNYELSADVFEVHDSNGARHSILSLVDVATKFHVAGRVAGGGVPSSKICAEMINTTWFSWAGAPDYFVCDQGVHNRGKVAHLLTSHGSIIRQTAARSPFQLGVGERHGGLLKEIMKRVIHERQLLGWLAGWLAGFGLPALACRLACLLDLLILAGLLVGRGRLQKLLAALPPQQRLKSLQYFSESLRSSLLRHMELQQMQRSTDASMSVRSLQSVRQPQKRKAPCQKKVSVSSSKGISMIKTKDGHRRYLVNFRDVPRDRDRLGYTLVMAIS
eukprot:s19_g16.t1